MEVVFDTFWVDVGSTALRQTLDGKANNCVEAWMKGEGTHTQVPTQLHVSLA